MGFQRQSFLAPAQLRTDTFQDPPTQDIFSLVASTQGNRATFISNVLSQLADYGFDGLDIVSFSPTPFSCSMADKTRTGVCWNLLYAFHALMKPRVSRRRTWWYRIRRRKLCESVEGDASCHQCLRAEIGDHIHGASVLLVSHELLFLCFHSSRTTRYLQQFKIVDMSNYADWINLMTYVSPDVNYFLATDPVSRIFTALGTSSSTLAYFHIPPFLKSTTLWICS